MNIWMKLYHIWQVLWQGKNGRFWTFVLGIGWIVLAACNRADTTIVVTEVVVVQGEEVVVTRLDKQEEAVTPEPMATSAYEPVTLDVSFLGDIPNIDPQKTTAANSIDLVENLFAGLTNFDLESESVEPELARSWEVSDNGRTWTFDLREDIYWVRPAAERTTVRGTVAVEKIRPVVAGDMVYTVQRICQRETETPDAFLLFLIEGCERVHNVVDASPGDINNIGVRALDDTTLQFTLTKPAGHFLTITSMWFMRPVPPELVEEYGDNWIDGTEETPLMTSGSFVLASGALNNDQTILHRNSEWPVLGGRTGNVDIVNISYFDEAMPAYQLWQAKALDVSPLPVDEREAAIESAPTKVRLEIEQTVFYIGYNFDSGVLREPEVRRALSAAIDRERLAEELYGGRAVGLRHLTPPGVVGAPPIDQVGIGYSPDYARQQMAASGFGSCRRMPPITFMVTSSDLSLQQAEVIRDMWIDELGCAPEQIVIEQVQFGSLLANTRREAGAARPDIWELGWSSYYPDAHNWLNDLLHCVDSENRQNRPCSEVDDLMRQGAGTIEHAERVLLFREVENLFFGGESIEPIAPLYVRGDYVLVQSWLEYTPALFGGEQYDTYTINADEKRLEQSR